MPKIIGMNTINDIKKQVDAIRNPEDNQEGIDKSIDYCLNHVGKYYDGSPKANSVNVAIGRMIYHAEKTDDMTLRSCIAQLMHDYRMYNFAYLAQGYVSAKRNDLDMGELTMAETEDITAEAASSICAYTDFMQIKLPDVYIIPAPQTGDDPMPDE